MNIASATRSHEARPTHSLVACSYCRFVGILALLPLHQLAAASLHVGSGQTHATISAAITAAAAGDNVVVHGGTYTESPITLNKSLTITNAPGAAPTVSGRFVVTAANVTISGLEITAWTTEGVTQHAISASGITGLTISNCWIHHNLRYGSSSAVNVRNSTRTTLRNNNIHDSCKGIVITSASSTDNTYANGTLIDNNDVFNNFNDGVDIHGKYITVSNNRIRDNIDAHWVVTHPDGIQFIDALVDGQSCVQHCRVFGNTVSNQTQNIFVESRTNSPKCSEIYIYNNLLYNTSGTVNGQDMDSLSTTLLVLAGNDTTFVHNNLLQRAGTLMSVRNLNPVTGATAIKNNIFHQPIARPCLFIEAAALVSASNSNRNLFHRTDGGAIVTVGSTTYATLPPLRSAHGFEINSVQSPPLLDGSFRPTQLSPAVGAAEPLNGLFTLDQGGGQRGARWDIGALEYDGAPINAQVQVQILP